MSDLSFSNVALPKSILKTLEEIGYTEMTPIQAQTLPLILFNRDVIAQAKTGSGKTAAYALGLLSKIDVTQSRVQSLVLCPTRELADQVSKEIRKLGRSIPNLKVITLCGGNPIKPQIASLEHGAHVVVATPGRIDEHLRKSRLRLNFLRTFILDEADRMLELGFKPILDSIFKQATIARQTMLFSATFPHSIEAVVDAFMADPVEVKIDDGDETKSNISQDFYKVENEQQKNLVLQLLIKERNPKTTLVFCTTKIQTQQLADDLKYKGFNALPLHGDLTQSMREQTLARFSNKSANVLVATDVAARGIDISGLDLVVNYELPLDSEVYVHRIGRTGRAGMTGMAISLYTQKDNAKLKGIENQLNIKVDPCELPSDEWMDAPVPTADWITIRINAGKKQKIRPGDVVGHLTKSPDITGDDIGDIALYDNVIFVAVKRTINKEAYRMLTEHKLKGKSIKSQTLWD